MSVLRNGSYSVVLESFGKQFSSSQVVSIDDVLASAPWLLSDGVKFNNAVISINEYGRMVWESGTWVSGSWSAGIWLSGVWLSGIWYSGSWYNGIWLNGVWLSGVWWNGDWYGGSLHGGTWHTGSWYGGIWLNGVWLCGAWELGLIINSNRDGNYDDSWEWVGEYVRSPISPKEYWVGVEHKKEIKGLDR